jgi:hypothetical protein
MSNRVPRDRLSTAVPCGWINFKARTVPSTWSIGENLFEKKKPAYGFATSTASQMSWNVLEKQEPAREN